MQLMINFLTNALKFTVSGFVFLRVRERRPAPSQSRSNSHIRAGFHRRLAGHGVARQCNGASHSGLRLSPL
jgi:hypothetical protein